jgi:hypothetical protein
VLAQGCDEVGVVLGSWAALGDEDGSGEIEVAGGGDAWGLRDVGEDDGDFDALKFSGSNGFGDSEKVGTAAGEEDS